MGYICLRSVDRYTGTPNFFQVQLAYPVCASNFKLESVLIPNSIYVINTDSNVFEFQRGSTGHSVTVSPGSYSIASLVLVLQTLMLGADSNGYTVTYSSTSMKVTI